MNFACLRFDKVFPKLSMKKDLCKYVEKSREIIFGSCSDLNKTPTQALRLCRSSNATEPSLSWSGLHRGAFCQFPFQWIYYCNGRPWLCSVMSTRATVPGIIGTRCILLIGLVCRSFSEPVCFSKCRSCESRQINKYSPSNFP